jgi:hypothetical protein
LRNAFRLKASDRDQFGTVAPLQQILDLVPILPIKSKAKRFHGEKLQRDVIVGNFIRELYTALNSHTWL